MVRLSDIARELDVSRSLVSKVLSGRMGTSTVRPELARAIRAKAKARNYRPNASAVAINSGRQNVIGVFIAAHGFGQPGSGLAEAVLEGVAGELARAQQRMMLQFFRTPADFEACLAMVHQSVLDGVVLAGNLEFTVRNKLRLFIERKIPMVTLLEEPLGPEFLNVRSDHQEVGRLATAHLIEQGCRRPVCLHVSSDSPGFRGYQIALREHGLPFAPELTCKTRTFAPGCGPRFVGDLLAVGMPFDGVVAASDHQASVILRILLKAGKRVPQDVKVIGVDDSPYCRYAVVPLSSVCGQNRKRASLAVRMLNEVIAGKPARQILLPPVVMARASTAT